MAINKEQAKELIECINENDIPKFFEQIDSYTTAPTPEISQLKREYISGRYGFDFYDRLKSCVNLLANTNFATVSPKYDLFFSFSSKNLTEAEDIAVKLRKSGLRVFFSKDSLEDQSGKYFLREIKEALKKSQHFLLLCTPEAIDSAYVQDECETFLQTYIESRKERRIFILRGTGFQLSLLEKVNFENIQTTELPTVFRILGKEQPQDDLNERMAEYKALFLDYYKDNIITEAERSILERTKKNLQLPNEIVIGIENAVVWEREQQKEKEELEKEKAWLKVEKERLEKEKQEQAENERIARLKVEQEAQEQKDKEEKEKREREKKERKAQAEEVKKAQEEKAEKERLEKLTKIQDFGKIQSMQQQTQAQLTFFERNKKVIFSAIAILFLLVLVFVLKDKIGGGNSQADKNKADTSQVTSEDSSTTNNQQPATQQPTINQDSLIKVAQKRWQDSINQLNEIERLVAETKAKEEEKAYNTALANATAYSYEAYLKKYPNGKYANEIGNKKQILIQKQQEDSDYKEAINRGTEIAYNNFLSKYPLSSYINDIQSRKNEFLKMQEEEKAYKNALSADNDNTYNSFLQKYPNSKYYDEIKQKLSNQVAKVKEKVVNYVDYNVRGTVVNYKSGKPMEGVIVNLKGTTTGCVTDSNGKYILNAELSHFEKGILIFRYKNKDRETININSRNRIDVKLK